MIINLCGGSNYRTVLYRAQLTDLYRLSVSHIYGVTLQFGYAGRNTLYHPSRILQLEKEAFSDN